MSRLTTKLTYFITVYNVLANLCHGEYLNCVLVARMQAFLIDSAGRYFSESRVYPDILCIIRCLQSESAIMKQTRLSFQILAAEQP